MRPQTRQMWHAATAIFATPANPASPWLHRQHYLQMTAGRPGCAQSCVWIGLFALVWAMIAVAAVVVAGAGAPRCRGNQPAADGRLGGRDLPAPVRKCEGISLPGSDAAAPGVAARQLRDGVRGGAGQPPIQGARWRARCRTSKGRKQLALLREAAAQGSAEANYEIYESHKSWDRGDLDKVPHGAAGRSRSGLAQGS